MGRIVSLSSGPAHTCALNREGEVWCWGRNDYGQAGGSPDPQPCMMNNIETGCVRQPHRIEGLPPAIDVASGTWHNCALSREGAVWCWGGNTQGQLGLGVFGLAPGAPPEDGTGSRTPRWVHGLPPVQSITLGGLTSCAHVGESLWCWGVNDMQQLRPTCGSGNAVPQRLGNLD